MSATGILFLVTAPGGSSSEHAVLRRCGGDPEALRWPAAPGASPAQSSSSPNSTLRLHPGLASVSSWEAVVGRISAGASSAAGIQHVSED